MRAAAVGTDRQIGVIDHPPATCGPGQVRIRIEACGLCGSDLHAWHQKSWSPGLIPGHEIVGRIDQVGTDPPQILRSRGLEPDRRVVVEPLESCRHCWACEAGRDPLCPELRIAGVHRPGGFAESIVLPAERVFAIDERIAPTSAALCEPLAVALHALDRGELEGGEDVLVIGGGTIGLLCAFVAQQRGAGRVIVRARHPQQRRFAEQVAGATVASLERETADAPPGDDFGLVIETVGGAQGTLAEACEAARPGARVVVVGLLAPNPTFDPSLALARELELRWANCYGHRPGEPEDFERAVALLEQHENRLRPLVTHEVPLDEIERAFSLAANKAEGAGKVVVVP